jgi:hypothetical protein
VRYVCRLVLLQQRNVKGHDWKDMDMGKGEVECGQNFGGKILRNLSLAIQRR